MESLNLVVLSGQIESSADIFLMDDGKEACNFSIKTFKTTGRGPEKTRTPQLHTVTMINPGTIGRHLLKGKAVVIQGRLEPCPGGPFDMIVATTIHFPVSEKRS
jgi:single-stranded DNA-binding protein